MTLEFDDVTADDEFDELDELLFGPDSSEAEDSPVIINCILPKSLPPKGKCAPSGGDASCTQGNWYLPRYGDYLTRVAQRALKASGVAATRETVRQYKRDISNHKHNRIFLSRSRSGWATRQFLVRWGGDYRRTWVGRRRGAGYGLMFLPPIGPGLTKAKCPKR